MNLRWRGKDYRLSLDRYLGRRIDSKTEAVAEAEKIRTAIREGTFGLPVEGARANPEPPASSPESLTFEKTGSMFVESYSKGRGKVSWHDDASMINRIMAYTPPWPGALRLGMTAVAAVTEQDLEAFIRHLGDIGRTTATRNHYVALLRTFDNWLVQHEHRTRSILSGRSGVIRKRKANARKRRLEPDEERKLLAAAGPHLQRVIICAVETGCRVGEIPSLQWREVSPQRREIRLLASKTKTATERTIAVSARLYAVLDLVKNDAAGELHGPSAYVFGDEIGEQIRDVKRAWQTAVLKAHGHGPTWVWAKGRSKKGSGRLSPESQEAYRAINLHLHDLRHEAGSRLLEAGWPLHQVQQMLGHANIQQTSTYLNATLQGLHHSMKTLDRSRGRQAKRRQTRPSCKPVANTPACDPLADGKPAPANDSKLLVN